MHYQLICNGNRMRRDWPFVAGTIPFGDQRRSASTVH